MRARRIFYRKTWDQRIEEWIERRPLVAALLVAPVVYGLIFLTMV